MIQKVLETIDGNLMIKATFCLSNRLSADKIHLVGDFNNWDRLSHRLSRNRKGEWIISVPLMLNKAYQFRYLIDGHHWTCDDNADAYVRNLYGSDNFMVITDKNFEKYHEP